MTRSTSPCVRVTGPLLRPAYTRVSPAGDAWLCVQIAQADRDGIPVHAEHRLGQGEVAQAVAARVAAGLRTGTVVTVRAARWEIQRNPDALHLLAVLGIEYPTPRPRHEAQEREAA